MKEITSSMFKVGTHYSIMHCKDKVENEKTKPDFTFTTMSIGEAIEVGEKGVKLKGGSIIAVPKEQIPYNTITDVNEV